MSYNITDFANRIQRLDKVYRSFPGRAATIAVAFSKDRFREQAWVDNTTQPWRKRKENARQRNKSQGRAILMKSGRLKRSIRKIRVGPSTAVVGTDVPYAAAHNYGFKGKVTVHSHSRRSRGKSSQVDGFMRGVTLPRRQFLGNSKVLASRIERDIASQIIKAIK
jgi:phage gpG-like protein